MFNLKLRISSKLAIASGFGVLALAIMVANDGWDSRVRDRLTAEVKAIESVQKSVLTASIATRRVALMNRDVRLANKDQDLEDAIRKLDLYGADGVRAFDAASSKAVHESRRQLLERAKDQLARYVATIRDGAQLQKNILALRADLTRQGLDWSKRTDAFFALPALAALPNRADLTIAVQRADASSAASRTAFWAYLVHGNEDSRGRIKPRLDSSTAALKEARALTTDETILKGIDNLSAFAPLYAQTIDKTFQAIAAQATMLRERADPLRLELDRTLDEAASAFDKRAAELEQMSAAQEYRSDLINWSGDALVLLALLGSTIFATLSVARPTRRIAAVLLELANGNKGVEIPYAERADEIGEAARAAETFKDNIARMEALEAEQHEVEARAAATRKTEMGRLADGFEAAVGGDRRLGVDRLRPAGGGCRRR